MAKPPLPARAPGERDASGALKGARDGKLRPVKVHVPEGTILNCRYPAPTGYAPGVGNILVAAASASSRAAWGASAST